MVVYINGDPTIYNKLRLESLGIQESVTSPLKASQLASGMAYNCQLPLVSAAIRTGALEITPVGSARRSFGEAAPHHINIQLHFNVTSEVSYEAS